MIGTEVLVRHAMAVADPARPPGEWELDAAGTAAAVSLAESARLGAVVAIVSSPEPKARATAAAFAAQVGLEVAVDERLVEAVRPWVGEQYRAVAHRYLSGAAPEGWEPREEVAARVAAAIAEARHGDDAGELIVVGHGLSLALHLEAVLPPGFDAFGFWARMAFPDAWRLDPAAGTLARVATRPRPPMAR